MTRYEEIGKLTKSRSDLKREQGDIDEYMRRLGQLLQHLQQLLETGYEVQLYDYVVGTATPGSGRIEDVRFEGLSLRDQILRFRQVRDDLADVDRRLKELDVD